LQGILTIWRRCHSIISYNTASQNHEQLLKIYKRFQSTKQVLSTNSESKSPKGIKNAINLEKKNGNNLWEEIIKTELKHLTYY
jgi:5-methylcytosine-specific restriction endonuclease McrBC GTP-binding regulatory subunit McrB